MQAASLRSLWFGLLAAPLAWTMQGLFGWWVGSRICGSLSVGGARTAVAAATVVALAVAIAAIAASWGNWRRASDGASIQAEPENRIEFMALGGLLVSGAFAIGIFWAGLSSLLLGACGRVR